MLKRPIYYSVVCFLVNACQPATQAVKTAPATVSPAPAAVLEPELRAFLAQYDVAPLLQKEAESSEVMNGFYGPNLYRVEFAMLSVVRDANDVSLLHVRGKDRYKGVVTPFEGEIRLAHLREQPPLPPARPPLVDTSDQENDPTAQSIFGTFELREAVDQKGAGVITGTVVIDFHLMNDNHLQLYVQGEDSPSALGQTKFEGIWKSNATQKKEDVVWVTDIFSFGSAIFDEFVIGERERDFNPKYAKLGWDTYWENEEWWAAPGPATARATAPDSRQPAQKNSRKILAN